MSIDFTNLALLVILLFGVFGWIRGIRRIAVATGGIFFAMAVLSVTDRDLIDSLGKLGVRFHPSAQADLFLAGFFLFTLCVVQLGGTLLILGRGRAPLDRRQRTGGFVLGLINGFLIIANVLHLADPYLRTTQDPIAGGWTWHLPLPHFSHPDPSTFSVSIAPLRLTITPSPLLQLYTSLPTALILLFLFLTFVFLGTLYGRVIRKG